MSTYGARGTEERPDVPSDDGWVDPFPRPRRRDSFDEKKKKKTKTRSRSEKKTFYFGDRSGKGEQGGFQPRREHLVRAPSEDYIPPPPRGFALSNPVNEVKKRDAKQLSLDDENAKPNRPGVVRVGVDSEEGFTEAEPTRTNNVTTTTPANADFLQGGGGDEDQQSSPPSGGVIAQAEPVNDAEAPGADLTAELQARIKMLEEEAQREEKEIHTQSVKCMLYTLLFLAVMGGAVGIIFVVVGNNNDDPPPEAPTRTPTTEPSSYPSAAPSVFPSSLPTVDVEELWTALIQAESPATTFFDTTSPEYQALEWMVQDPFTKSIFNDTDRVLQRFAMAVIWYATNSVLGGDWLRETTECHWALTTAVRCDVKDKLVSFGLRFLGLSGTIPKELGLLSALTYLALDGNKLEGTVPSEIGKLTQLNLIDFSGSDELRGTVPTEIGLLTLLTMFIQTDTSLEGALPTEIGMLASMELFSVPNNNLTSTLPSEIGLMSSMDVLDVANNPMSGTVPSEVAEFTILNQLHIYGTDLSGTIPSSLCAPKRSLRIDCGSIECTCCTSENLAGCDSPTN